MGRPLITSPLAGRFLRLHRHGRSGEGHFDLRCVQHLQPTAPKLPMKNRLV